MWVRETRSPFSTESELPTAWPLADYPVDLVARLHGCDVKAARAMLVAQTEHQRSDAWIDDTLARLSAPALVVLEILAAHGGFLHEAELEGFLEDHFGLSQIEGHAAIAQCLPPLLVVPLASPRGRALALVAPAADRIAHRVAGLGDADPPARALEPAPHDDGRGLLAVAAWLGQLDLKLTQAYEPHKAGVKRIAKQLGVPEARVDELARIAWRLELVNETEDGVLRPNQAALTNAAAGRFPNHRMTDAVVERLRVLGTPLALRTIDRWSWSCAVRQVPILQPAQLAHLPGVGLVVDPTPAKAAARRERGGGGAAVEGRTAEDDSDVHRYLVARTLPSETAVTVTPSFEVFIAPEAKLGDLVAVVALCEPVRLDRVIVGRLTRASLQRAAAAGLTAEDIIARLAAASRTALPDNVRAAIRDWVQSNSIGMTATGRVIVVDAALQDRLVSLLPPIAAARVVAPGVLVCSLELPERAVAIAFEKLGVTARRDPPMIVSPPSEDPGTPLPHLVTAPASLRARIARYLAGDPAERAQLQPTIDRMRGAAQPAHDRARRTVDVRERDRLVGDVDDEDRDLVDDDPEGEWDDAWDAAPPAVHALVSRFEQRTGAELTIRQYGALVFALTQLAQAERSHILHVRDAATAFERLGTIVAARIALRGDSTGRLQRALETLGLAAPAAGKMASAARSKTAGQDAGPGTATGAASRSPLEWHRTDLVARLSAAARVHARLVLDLGSRHQEIHLHKLVTRGNTLMVLGVGPDDEGIAVPIETICGIADVPASDKVAAPEPQARWTPVAGMQPPGGHAPCPCGSGKRYRHCCRDAPA